MGHETQFNFTFHHLPFENLSPDDFEELCIWILNDLGYINVQHYGALGADNGIDLTAEKTTVFHYGNVKE